MNTDFSASLEKTNTRPPHGWPCVEEFVEPNVCKVFIPFNIGRPGSRKKDHWTLAVIDIENEQLEYYCSMHDSYGQGPGVLDLLASTVAKIDTGEVRKWKKPVATWTKAVMTSIPKQTNGNDCGPFVCMFADCLSEGVPLQPTVNGYRVQMTQWMKDERVPTRAAVNDP